MGLSDRPSSIRVVFSVSVGWVAVGARKRVPGLEGLRPVWLRRPHLLHRLRAHARSETLVRLFYACFLVIEAHGGMNVDSVPEGSLSPQFGWHCMFGWLLGKWATDGPGVKIVNQIFKTVISCYVGLATFNFATCVPRFTSTVALQTNTEYSVLKPSQKGERARRTSRFRNGFGKSCSETKQYF